MMWCGFLRQGLRFGGIRGMHHPPSSSIQSRHSPMNSLFSCCSWRTAPFSRQFQYRTDHHNPNLAYATTILSVRKGDEVVIIGDGQVTQGDVVVKPNAKKIRRIGDGIIVGFAGVTADALCLFELLEQKLEAYPDQLLRACVEMAKSWRLGKQLRPLEATMIVANREMSLTITGMGDVLQPHDGLIAIGSGGNYALSAARALLSVETNLTAEEIARVSMKVAADLCIYTNHEFSVEKISKEIAKVEPSQEISKNIDESSRPDNENIESKPENLNPTSDDSSKSS